MKKNLRYFFGAVGVGLAAAQNIFAITTDEMDSSNSALGTLFSVLFLISMACIVFSPLLVYIWYQERGGKNKWFALPALLLPLAFIGSIFGFVLINPWPFVPLYFLFVPAVSYYLFVRAGGKKKLWHLSIFLLFLALLLKGITSLVMGVVK